MKVIGGSVRLRLDPILTYRFLYDMSGNNGNNADIEIFSEFF